MRKECVERGGFYSPDIKTVWSYYNQSMWYCHGKEQIRKGGGLGIPEIDATYMGT